VLRRVLQLPAQPLVARDLVEDLPARLREREEDDGLVRVRVDVLPRPRELEVLPGHLGDALRLVLLDQVVVGRPQRRRVDEAALRLLARASRLGRAARATRE